MKKIKKRKVSKFRTGIKKLVNTLMVISILSISGLSVYAFATYKVKTATGEKLNELTSIVAQYKAEDMNNEIKGNRSTVAIIESVCLEEEFDVDLAMRIAACESYLNQYFVHTNTDGSIDRGVFAFNSRYYKDVSNECSFDVECATRIFVQQAKSGNINDWLCYKRVK